MYLSTRGQKGVERYKARVDSQEGEQGILHTKLENQELF
jgi:hypothetical protein